MSIIRYTLLADGSSDSMLLPIINWVISTNFPHLNFEPQFARNIGEPGFNLADRIEAAVKIFPCDVLFLHRDAENQGYSSRLEEIKKAMSDKLANYVPVIPVRMTESWMLSDESAIRAAAGNRNGKIALQLPAKKKWEEIPDPKQTLFDALICASEKTGRALSKFNPHRQRARVTELTENFLLLRGLTSFDAFESGLIDQFNKF